MHGSHGESTAPSLARIPGLLLPFESVNNMAPSPSSLSPSERIPVCGALPDLWSAPQGPPALVNPRCIGGLLLETSALTVRHSPLPACLACACSLRRLALCPRAPAQCKPAGGVWHQVPGRVLRRRWQGGQHRCAVLSSWLIPSECCILYCYCANYCTCLAGIWKPGAHNCPTRIDASTRCPDCLRWLHHPADSNARASKKPRIVLNEE